MLEIKGWVEREAQPRKMPRHNNIPYVPNCRSFLTNLDP
jgi:hypothetical protein